MISKLLVREPSERLNAEQILAHPWLNGQLDPNSLLDKVPKKMGEYNARKRFRKGGLAVIAANKLVKLKGGEDMFEFNKHKNK